MTKDELNELSKAIEIFTKNDKSVKELLSKIDYLSFHYLDNICIYDDYIPPAFHFDIKKLSKEAKTRIAKAIELEITSKLDDLQKEFDSLKLSRDE